MLHIHILHIHMLDIHMLHIHMLTITQARHQDRQLHRHEMV